MTSQKKVILVNNQEKEKRILQLHTMKADGRIPC